MFVNWHHQFVINKYSTQVCEQTEGGQAHENNQHAKVRLSPKLSKQKIRSVALGAAEEIQF